MNKNTLLAPLFVGAMVFGFAGAAQADPIYLDFSADGGVDGHFDQDVADPDQVTEDFDQLGVFANTTTTQFDSDGSGDLSNGDAFSDSGHLNVTALLPGAGGDNEGLNSLTGWQMTAEWTDLTGTSSELSPAVDPEGNPVQVGTIQYDSVGNTTFDFYVDFGTNGIDRTNFDYGPTVAETDDVDGTFNDGTLVLSVLIVGGEGTNTFDEDGNFISGSSILIGEVTFALEDFWFFADGDLDFADLLGSLVQIEVFIDQNTDDVITTPSACNLAQNCQPGEPLFVVDSSHDGSIDFALVQVPEPASLLMFGLGFLALGGLGLATRRQA